MNVGLIKAKQILDTLVDCNIVAGISGGIDSMCLIDLILKSGIDKNRVSVVHVDHNLREDSKRDRQFVEQYCFKHGLKIKVFSPDILKLCKESGRSIETEARAFRHSVFKKSCEDKNALLLLAHTASDQAETVLMHIFRGCGMAGLRGMSERDGFIVRPMIYMRRNEVELYAKENDIAFCEDITNSDLVYDRNFVRSLIKNIETRYENASGHINRLSYFAKELLDSQAIISDYIKQSDGVVLLDKRTLDEPLKNQYIINAAKSAGLVSDLESKHVFTILELKNKPVGCRINLPHGIICAVERENLSFYKAEAKNEAEIEFKEGENVINGIRILALECPLAFQKGEIIADADKLKNAVIRFRKNGDSFTPCNGRNKKLKEYLNGKKIENRLKDNTPLICSGGEVLVICGVELSDSVKITNETKRALKIVVDYGKS